jgi:acyl-CoA dehydrogenase
MNVMTKPAAAVRPDLDPELNNLAMSKEAQPLFDAVMKHIQENVAPISDEFFRLGEGRKDNWSWAPGQLELLEGAKNKAKASGLWNFFLPHSEIGRGLTNLDYAYIAAELGKQPLASESLNCSAPDTGNMEVLEKVGTPAQKEKWLKPLLNGEIRSCFAMTEPAVASSDARNVECRIESDGDDYVINGRKWWSSGMGDPRCKVIILMGKSDPNAPAYRQQSMIVVPRDAKGIKIVKMLHVFGYDDAPHGHAEVVYDNVRVPKSSILLGEGRGFEIAQGRLGPGRIHHCMRAIGVAERALEMAIKRAKSRVAFGQRISEMGVTKAHVADMRMEIDMARLLVLKAAWAMDKFGNKEARQQIAMIKVAVPNITSKVVDRCLQLHGAGGVSQVFKLASMYAHQRTLRLADGPDEVHRDQVGRLEIAKYN